MLSASLGTQRVINCCSMGPIWDRESSNSQLCMYLTFHCNKRFPVSCTEIVFNELLSNPPKCFHRLNHCWTEDLTIKCHLLNPLLTVYNSWISEVGSSCCWFRKLLNDPSKEDLQIFLSIGHWPSLVVNLWTLCILWNCHKKKTCMSPHLLFAFFLNSCKLGWLCLIHTRIRYPIYCHEFFKYQIDIAWYLLYYFCK